MEKEILKDGNENINNCKKTYSININDNDKTIQLINMSDLVPPMDDKLNNIYNENNNNNNREENNKTTMFFKNENDDYNNNNFTINNKSNQNQQLSTFNLKMIKRKHSWFQKFFICFSEPTKKK